MSQSKKRNQNNAVTIKKDEEIKTPIRKVKKKEYDTCGINPDLNPCGDANEY